MTDLLHDLTALLAGMALASLALAGAAWWHGQVMGDDRE